MLLFLLLFGGVLLMCVIFLLVEGGWGGWRRRKKGIKIVCLLFAFNCAICFKRNGVWMTIIKIHMPRVGYFIYSKSSKHPRMEEEKENQAQNCVRLCFFIPSFLLLFSYHSQWGFFFILDFPSSISRKKSQKSSVFFSFFFFCFPFFNTTS